MKIKNLISLIEQQELSIIMFHKLATSHKLAFEKIYKFLYRLERLRKIK